MTLQETSDLFRAEAASAAEDVLDAFPAAIAAMQVLLDAAAAYNAVMPTPLAPNTAAQSAMEELRREGGRRPWPKLRLDVDRIVAEVVAKATGNYRTRAQRPVAETLEGFIANLGPEVS